MKKKMGNLKVMVSAIMTIAMCLSLLVGASYALFTTERKVNIAVTSGNVDVLATVDAASLKLASMGTDTTASGAFTTGGTVSFNGNDVNIAGIAPGDKAEFKIDIANNSTVHIAYRVTLQGGETTNGGIVSDKSLMDYLTVMVDGSLYVEASMPAWNTAKIGDRIGDADGKMTISIEMPQSTLSEAMGLSQTISVSLLAVQANGIGSMPGSITETADKNADGNYEVKTPLGEVAFDTDATAAIESAANGKTIESIVMAVGQAEDIVAEDSGIVTKTFALNLVAKFTDGSSSEVSNFGSGKAEVCVFIGKNISEQVFEVNYVDSDGVRTPVNDGVYDAAEGTYTFYTNHFSIYEVLVHPVTKDIAFTPSADGTSYAVANKSIKLETVVIPGSYQGKPVTIGKDAFETNTNIKKVVLLPGVTALGADAFYNCSNLESITLPEGITAIGNGAFRGCAKLKSITLPESLTELGSSVFQSCTSLTNVVIPSQITRLESHLFNGCSNLESVTIPEGVTEMGQSIFLSNKKLTEVVLPDSLTSVGIYAFMGCSALKSITIPAGVTTLNAPQPASAAMVTNTFSGCSSLESFTVAEGNSIYSSVDGILYNAAQTEMMIVPAKLNGAVIVPQGVVKIATAFSNCTQIESIHIPESVTSIDAGGFKGCTKLKSITVDSGNTKFKSDSGILYDNPVTKVICAPMGLSGAISILEGVTAMNERDIFSNRVNITSVVIPASMLSLNYAFENCTGLTSVTFATGSKITTIGNEAFVNCTSLTSFVIPASATNIMGNAFKGCSSLESITVEEGNTAYYSEGNCVITKSNKSLVVGCKTSVIPSGVKKIFNSAFISCSGLTEITIPEGVTEIGFTAFWGCANLTTVNIAASVKTISSTAFSNCTSLTTINFAGTAEAWKKMVSDINFGIAGCTVNYGTPSPVV